MSNPSDLASKRRKVMAVVSTVLWLVIFYYSRYVACLALFSLCCFLVAPLISNKDGRRLVIGASLLPVVAVLFIDLQLIKALMLFFWIVFTGLVAVSAADRSS